jgi:glycine hydroxymethyltransferase
MKASFDLDGRQAQDVLDRLGLSANCNAIPGDPLPPYRPSGLRLGTPAITTRGLKEEHMEQIAEWMLQAIQAKNDNRKLDALRQEVITFAKQFPLPSGF